MPSVAHALRLLLQSGRQASIVAMTDILRALGESIAGRVDVINCVDFRQDQSLDFLFAEAPPRVNHLSISPSESEYFWVLKSLGQVPTAWAHLCLLDITSLPAQRWQEGIDNALRLTADQGLILVCAAEGNRNQLLSFTKALNGSIRDHVASFGVDSTVSAWPDIAWYQRNSRFRSDTSRREANLISECESQLSVARQLLGSTRQELARLQSQLPVEPDPLLVDGPSFNVLEEELELTLANVAALNHSIEEMQSALHQTQETLRMRESELQNAWSAFRRMEEEKVSLQQDLSAMTLSFRQSQDTLHQVINSRFWRLTAIPRRLIDALRFSRASAAKASPSILPSADPQSSPGPGPEESCDSEPGDREPLSIHVPEACCSPSSAVAEWTGTFMNLEDTCTRVSPRRGERVLFVDWRLPEPDKDSGSCRIYQIMAIASSGGCGIDFIGDANQGDQDYVDLLADLGINIVIGRDSGVRHLKRFGSQFRTIVLSRPEVASFYLPLVRCFAPRAKVIYDTVDLHYIRFQRGLELCKDDPQERLRMRALSRSYRSGEIFMSKVSDGVIVVTETEKQVLAKSVDADRITVIPNIHPVDHPNASPPFIDRQGLLFVGGFDHAPNVDAVNYFCKDVLPLIRQALPGCVLHVVGSNMPDSIRQLKSDDINPIGYLQSLDAIFSEVRLFVAPLRYGAGLKGKVGQSMSYGVPVVGTSIAFEGFNLVDRQHGLLGDTPADFAEALIEGYTNPLLWSTISQGAKQLVESNFSPQKIAANVNALLWGER